MEVSYNLIKPYFLGQYHHPAYDVAVDRLNHLRFHFDGYQILDENGNTRENPYFDKLILKTRPSETEKVRNYRRHIYVDETTITTKKVLNTLKKIPKANDWSISFKQSEVPKVIKEGETLEDYTSHNFPIFRSLTNWMFDFFLRKILIDPNGVCYTLPDFDVPANEFLKPVNHYVSSEDVLEYKADELVILKESKPFMSNGRVMMDKFLKIFSRNGENIEYWIAIPTKTDHRFDLIFVRNLEVTEFPAWRIGGESVDMIKGTPIFNSYVQEMLPSLDKAARDISDLDSAVLLSLFPSMWYLGGQACNSCQGTGQLPKDGGMVVCSSCKGQGQMQHSPYTDVEVKKANIGEPQLPTPPVGYIEKDTTTIKVQTERVEQHKANALSAVNMEFLADTPLNQSGKAKEVDKEELNTFVYDVARHTVKTLEKSYTLINDYRYSTLIPNVETRKAMMPTFNVPQDFSILNPSQRLNEVAKAREAKVSPSIISEQEKDYANVQFKTQPITKGKITAIININPFPGVSPEEIDNNLLAGTITKKDAIISIYASDFVEQAISEDADFIKLDLQAQKEIIGKLADAKLTELNATNSRPVE